MLVNPSSAALARALLALARTRKTGVLHAQGAGRAAQIAIVEGTPRAIQMVAGGPCLGDILTEEGALDHALHQRALESREASGPIGRFLVESGAARASAVSYALRKQLRYRAAALFQWGVIELRFEQGEPDVELPLLEEPMPAAELVLVGLRGAVDLVPVHLLRRRIGDGMLKLTGFGELLVSDAALHPEEAAMIPALRRGAAAADLVSLGGGRMRAVRSLAGFCMIGAAEPPSPGHLSYGLLLKKRNQLRHAASPETLLELPRHGDPRAARASLRRLAKELHPDRFKGGAPAPIERLSSEVLTALLDAEARLRDREARR
jgi:hypothetical protein